MDQDVEQKLRELEDRLASIERGRDQFANANDALASELKQVIQQQANIIEALQSKMTQAILNHRHVTDESGREQVLMKFGG